MYENQSRKLSRSTTIEGSTLNQKVARIAKTVDLRERETKHHVNNLGNFIQLHNVSRRYTNNLLGTSQGVSDVTGNRIGDQITLGGVKKYPWFLQQTDRPNVTFKIWVVKGRTGLVNTVLFPLKQITGIVVMDPLDTEKCKSVAVQTCKFLG